MELKVIIVTIACFSCLVPPVYSTGLESDSAALSAATESTCEKAAALAAKGAAVVAAKGAAVVAAKGALLKGILAAKAAALLAAKGIAIKKALVAKAALVGGAAVLGVKVVKKGAVALAAKLPALKAAAKLPAQHSLASNEHVVNPAVPQYPEFILEYTPEFQYQASHPSSTSTALVETVPPYGLLSPEVKILVPKTLNMVWSKLEAAARLKSELSEAVFGDSQEAESPAVVSIQSPRPYPLPYIVTEDIKN